MIVILDYGLGNLRSVQKACQHLGFDAQIRDSLVGASHVILPGVGAFSKAMDRLNSLKAEIQAYARSGSPLMGICLGQQLLFEKSAEFGECKGLGILSGDVRYLPSAKGLKLPQIGWNSISPGPASKPLEGVQPGSYVYFVHSLYTHCDDEQCIAAWTEYGVKYASAIQSGNVWGTQFHPEKSGEVGLKILKNFLEIGS